MSVNVHLNGSAFIEMIRAGHARLKAMVGTVNGLNIFPVPDGDTGTNMELSLASGVDRLRQLSAPDLTTACQALSSGLLMGARGNSGVILSQLFRGFSKVSQSADVLDVHLFARALQEGVGIAYRAVAKPVEGTMLTVAREAANAGLREAKHTTSLAAWIDSVYRAATTALAKTPEQLPVLKQAGVVDSGGQGLVFILEGFHQFLNGVEIDHDAPMMLTASDIPSSIEFAGAHIHHEGEYGYCTEVLIRAEQANTSEAELRVRLAQYGDSLLVVSAENLVKVHVHTLHPGRVLEDALEYGTLLKIKIDNMTEQHTLIQERSVPVEVSEATDLAVRTIDASGLSQGFPQKPLAIAAVVAGDGLREVFSSLGVDQLISGGQTMNPSTEEIVAAIETANAAKVIVLPNNKNIVMAAQQARDVIGDRVLVVPTTSIPEGIAAMMAYQPNVAPEDNVQRMTEACGTVQSGTVVRAVRDSVYQEQSIHAGAFLGFTGGTLVHVGDSREQALEAVVQQLVGQGNAKELLTVFYGADVPEQDAKRLDTVIGQRFGLEVEAHYGGQPVYDFILSVE